MPGGRPLNSNGDCLKVVGRFRLEFALPDDLTVDEFGAFSIWCIPASANLAHVEL